MVFWNEGYDVITYVNDVTNKFLSRDSNYIVDLWPKLGNSSICMREVITNTQLYQDLTRKTTFFEGLAWSKFYNLGLALGKNLTFSANVAKGLKLKARKFWGLIPTIVETTGEKLVGRGRFFSPTPLHQLE